MLFQTTTKLVPFLDGTYLTRHLQGLSGQELKTLP